MSWPPKEKRPILIDFTGVNCANCRLMEQRVLPRPEVVNLLKQFVTIQLYTDYVPIASITAAQRKELAEQQPGTPARPRPGGDEPVLRRADARRQGTRGVRGGLQRASGFPRLPDQGSGKSTRGNESGPGRAGPLTRSSEPEPAEQDRPIIAPSVLTIVRGQSYNCRRWRVPWRLLGFAPSLRRGARDTMASRLRAGSIRSVRFLCCLTMATAVGVWLVPALARGRKPPSPENKLEWVFVERDDLQTTLVAGGDLQAGQADDGRRARLKTSPNRKGRRS